MRVEEAGQRPAGAGEEPLGLAEEQVGMADLPDPFVQEMPAQCQPQNDQHHDGPDADGEFVGIQGIPPSLQEIFVTARRERMLCGNRPNRISGGHRRLLREPQC